ISAAQVIHSSPHVQRGMSRHKAESDSIGIEKVRPVEANNLIGLAIAGHGHVAEHGVNLAVAKRRHDTGEHIAISKDIAGIQIADYIPSCQRQPLIERVVNPTIWLRT